MVQYLCENTSIDVDARDEVGEIQCLITIIYFYKLNRSISYIITPVIVYENKKMKNEKYKKISLTNIFHELVTMHCSPVSC